MKLSIQKDTITTALGSIYRAADAKSTMFVMANVMLRAVKDRLEMTTGSSVTSMRRYAICDVIAEGSTTVSAKALHDVVKNAAGDSIMMEVDGSDPAGWLVIKSGRSRFKLATMATDDFLPFPDLEGEELLHIPAQSFDGLLASVEYAASKDSGRPHLSSIHISERDDVLLATTTDGHRLARTSSGASTMSGEMLLPLDAVGHIRRMIDGSGSDLTITKKGKRLWVALDEVELTVSEYDARFPPADKVIPSGPCHVVRVAADLLDAAIRRAMVVVDSGSMIEFRFEKGDIEVAATTSNMAEASESVQVESWSIEDTLDSPMGERVGLNARYIADAIDHVGSEIARIEYRGATAAIVIRPDEMGTADVAVVMPMRVS